MREKVKQLLLFVPLSLFVLLSFFFSSLPVYGEVLPSGLVIGDLKGLTITNEGKYFIDLQDVKPGKVYTKEIAIRNVDKDEGFDVKLLVEPGKATGSIDFTKAVTVKLERKEGETLYEGGILGKDGYDWTTEPLHLGQYMPGAESTLKATFTVSEELGAEDFKEASEYDFTWHFLAESPEIKDSSSTSSSSTPSGTTTSSSKTILYPSDSSIVKPTGFLPKTGEEWEALLYKVCAGLFLVLLMLFVWRKRQVDKKEEHNQL